MWLMTTIGFFSVVEKPWDRPEGTLTVRARVRKDLVALKFRCPSMGPIKRDQRADYCFRARVRRSDLGSAIYEMVEWLNYENFKSAIVKTDGLPREGVYLDVWARLRDLDQLNPPKHRQNRGMPRYLPTKHSF